MYTGCVLDQISWQMQRSGLLTADAKLIAQGENVVTATAAGTPTAYGMPKASATVIAQGDQVAWDDTVKETALPGVGLFPVGIATAAAGRGNHCRDCDGARMATSLCRCSDYADVGLQASEYLQLPCVWVGIIPGAEGC
jgi:predicted RecA/RadA family phage recombinase